MKQLTVKKVVAVVVNVFLVALLFWLVVNRPDAGLLTTVVLWLFAVSCIGSLLYFLYWVPTSEKKKQAKLRDLHCELRSEPCESRAN